MKSHLRESKASGSTRALVERIFRGARKPKRLRRVEWRGYTIKVRGEM